MGDLQFIDTMIKDGLWDIFNGYHMGNTAENVAKRLSDHPRAAGCQFALASRSRRPPPRRRRGRFKDEIVAGDGEGPQGRRGRRPTTNTSATTPTLETMAKLRPAFTKDGTVTAANASGINDGAAAIVVMSARRGRRSAA